MISNERQSLAAQQSNFQEDFLLYKRVEIGRRSYAFALNENAYGQLLRITEKADDCINSMIVPDVGMASFLQLMDEMVTASRQEPPLIISEAGEALSVYERTLKIAGIETDWKSFLFVLIEDFRGRYLQIIEKATGGRRITLIISADGLETFQKILAEMVVALGASPNRSIPATCARALIVKDDILRSVKMRVERKSLMLMLKESPRGKQLRLTEKVGERFACVIIPADLMEQFNGLLHKIIQVSEDLERCRPPGATATLASERLSANGKVFILNLQQNQAGRFLRLIEDQGGYGDKSIAIPARGLPELKKQIDEMIKISNDHPPTASCGLAGS